MLRARWLGTVSYSDALALQHGIFDEGCDDYLLLLEHPPVYTLGVRARPEHLLADPATIGADVVATDRGGDVTFHGPGQLVGYPIVSLPFSRGVVAEHVHGIEQLLLDACASLGVTGLGRRDGYPGLWFAAGGPDTPRKVCAIGVRMSRGRTMHGFALNVDTEMSWFDRIVPCGLAGSRATSLAAEGYGVRMDDLVSAVVAGAAERWGSGVVDFQAGRAARDGAPDGVPIGIAARKPAWLRAPARMGGDFLTLKSTMRNLDLVTVCEEAGCPNIFECWSEGTATFMINGDRCTRACGFCRVDTRRPLPPDPEEPARVARAVERLGLGHAVVTAVARDDLPDGGAAGFVATLRSVRRRVPGCSVEVLIPDCKGSPASLEAIFAERPEVLNHNLETVLRLQRRVRPSASYARSLAVLARAKASGLTTKSGLMVGLGESSDELLGALADLREVGVSIVTVGQYLRPSSAHLPVQRYWEPGEIEELGDHARRMGFAHVEASPLTRSSYHARRAIEPAGMP